MDSQEIYTNWSGSLLFAHIDLKSLKKRLWPDCMGAQSGLYHRYWHISNTEGSVLSWLSRLYYVTGRQNGPCHVRLYFKTPKMWISLRICAVPLIISWTDQCSAVNSIPWSVKFKRTAKIGSCCKILHIVYDIKAFFCLPITFHFKSVTDRFKENNSIENSAQKCSCSTYKLPRVSHKPCEWCAGWSGALLSALKQLPHQP